jgi:anti-anti-sigma factor
MGRAASPGRTAPVPNVLRPVHDGAADHAINADDLRRAAVHDPRVLDGLGKQGDPKPQIRAQPLPLLVTQPGSFGQLTLQSTRAGDVHSICVSGELDLASAARLEHEIARVETGDARSIVVDLSGLLYLDSTGVRLLLGVHARLRPQSGRLMLVRGPREVQRVFELCGVADVLPFAD